MMAVTSEINEAPATHTPGDIGLVVSAISQAEINGVVPPINQIEAL